MELRAISIVEGHRGYADWRKYVTDARGDGNRIHVYLDGVDQKGAVISADVDAGWVHRTKMDERGQYVHDGNEWIEETMYGRVRIVVVLGSERTAA